MIRKIALFFIFYAINLLALANFEENFAISTSLNYPDFIISDDEKLQLNASAAGESSAYFESKIVANAVWETDVEMYFNPSSSNYCCFYVMSNQSNFSSELDGYYVYMGGTNDEFSLYRQLGSNKTKLITGTSKRLDLATCRFSVKLTRSLSGEFALYSKLESEESYTLEGICVDDEVQTSSFCGYFCKYTETRKDKFLFDNLNVAGQDFFPIKTLIIPHFGDLVFSELMVRPTPEVGLPPYEYMEIYNRSDKNIHLKNVQLGYGDKRFALPDSIIYAHEYVVLCAEKAYVEMSQLARCVVVSSFPALANEGKLLTLYNQEEEIVSWVEYSSSWYSDSFRSEGGWSLECIDLDNFNQTSDNWSASQNKQGGTPGKSNSVADTNPNNFFPEVVKVGIIDCLHVCLEFSKPMKISDLCNISNYKSNQIEIDSVEVILPKGKEMICHLKHPIREGVLYEISLVHLRDLDGNELNDEVKLAIPSELDVQDVVINELLFNAETEGSKFVELYNRSDKIVDLSHLLLTNIVDNKLDRSYSITKNSTLIFPNEYVVLVYKMDNFEQTYSLFDGVKYIEMSLSFINQKEGTLALVKRDATIIDRMIYDDKMHISLLSDTKGVSLEKINPDWNGANKTSWTSAAELVGYATPGYQNSQYFESTQVKGKKEFWYENQVFTPNGDGDEDLLRINYVLTEKAAVATVRIFDAVGRQQKSFTDLLGTQGVIYWDGSKDNGVLADVGPYIVWIEIRLDNGETKRYKLVVVLK